MTQQHWKYKMSSMHNSLSTAGSILVNHTSIIPFSRGNCATSGNSHAGQTKASTCWVRIKQMFYSDDQWILLLIQYTLENVLVLSSSRTIFLLRVNKKDIFLQMLSLCFSTQMLRKATTQMHNPVTVTRDTHSVWGAKITNKKGCLQHRIIGKLFTELINQVTFKTCPLLTIRKNKIFSYLCWNSINLLKNKKLDLDLD